MFQNCKHNIHLIAKKYFFIYHQSWNFKPFFQMSWFYLLWFYFITSRHVLNFKIDIFIFNRIPSSIEWKIVIKAAIWCYALARYTYHQKICTHLCPRRELIDKRLERLMSLTRKHKLTNVPSARSQVWFWILKLFV